MTIGVLDKDGNAQTINTIDDLLLVVATAAAQATGNTSLAAILAKLSDPATQTTLAALVSANHTDLAAILTALGTNHADELQLHTDVATTLIAKNEAIRAVLAGTLAVGVAAGTNLIGKVGLDQTTPGSTDHVTGSGFATAVGGTIQRPADTNAYAIGDIVAQSTTAGSCSGIAFAAARANDLTGMLRRCRVKVNDAAWLNAQLYVHVFKDTPTFSSGDNAAFAAALTESNYIGAFDVTLDRSFSDPFVKGVGAPRSGSEMNFEPHAGSQNLYFVIETRSVVTPGSGKTFTVTFEALQN